MKKILLLLCIPYILLAGNKDDLKYLNQVRWNYSQNNLVRENAIFWMGNANAAQINKVATVMRFKVKKNGEKELIETKVYNKQGMKMVGKWERVKWVGVLNFTVGPHRASSQHSESVC